MRMLTLRQERSVTLLRGGKKNHMKTLWQFISGLPERWLARSKERKEKARRLKESWNSHLTADCESVKRSVEIIQLWEAGIYDDTYESIGHYVFTLKDGTCTGRIGIVGLVDLRDELKRLGFYKPAYKDNILPFPQKDAS